MSAKQTIRPRFRKALDVPSVLVPPDLPRRAVAAMALRLLPAGLSLIVGSDRDAELARAVEVVVLGLDPAGVARLLALDRN